MSPCLPTPFRSLGSTAAVLILAVALAIQCNTVYGQLGINGFALPFFSSVVPNTGNVGGRVPAPRLQTTQNSIQITPSSTGTAIQPPTTTATVEAPVTTTLQATAIFAEIQRCVKDDPTLRAMRWMLFTMYTCALIDEDGCAAMLSAGDVPFGTEQEYKDALTDAMTAAGECVQANAQNSAGRNLKSWGAQVVKDHPLEGLTALTRICKNAAVFGTSGTTLAEASESGVLDTVAELSTNMIQSVVSLSLASLTSDASGYISATRPPTAVATDAVFGNVLHTLLYPESEATCQSKFGKQACLDLRSSSDTSIRSWVQTSTCQTCSDYLLKACKSNVNRQYATKFKTIVGLSNIISSFPNGILFTHRALEAASAAAVMGSCGLSAEAFAEARSNQAGLIIVSLKESALLPLWRTWSLARSFINQPGWLAQQSVRTGFTAARESATAWASRFVLASSRIYVADSQTQVLSAVKRPYCTNQLISDTDPCRPGERVWCCAGVKTSSQLQGPCQYLGYAGTTTACDNSDMPMRYCCPTTQNPGPLPAGVVEEVTVVTPEGVKTTTVTRG